MRLYHFTAFDHWEGGSDHGGPGIRHAGIIPNRHPYIPVGRMVWLTDDPAWAQPWSVRKVPGSGCDRTEVRLEVTIPKADRSSLLPWTKVATLVDPQAREDLEAFADPTRWWVFLGRIPAGWVRRVERRADYSFPIPALGAL